MYFTYRTSPSIVSPHSQQTIPHSQILNGPPALNMKPVSISSGILTNTSTTEPISTLKAMSHEVVSRAGLDTQASSPTKINDTRQQMFNSSGGGNGGSGNIGSGNDNVTSLSNGPNANINNLGNIKSTGTSEAHIPPLLSVAPLGTSPLQKEHQIQFQMMEAAFYHLPTPSDSERFRQYLHRQPIQTPHYYPQVIYNNI